PIRSTTRSSETSTKVNVLRCFVRKEARLHEERRRDSLRKTCVTIRPCTNTTPKAFNSSPQGITAAFVPTLQGLNKEREAVRTCLNLLMPLRLVNPSRV